MRTHPDEPSRLREEPRKGIRHERCVRLHGESDALPQFRRTAEKPLAHEQRLTALERDGVFGDWKRAVGRERSFKNGIGHVGRRTR